MENKLEPCSVCGGEGAVYSDGWRMWYGVSCLCGHKTGEYRTEKEAVEAWNRSFREAYPEIDFDYSAED